MNRLCKSKASKLQNHQRQNHLPQTKKEAQVRLEKKLCSGAKTNETLDVTVLVMDAYVF